MWLCVVGCVLCVVCLWLCCWLCVVCLWLCFFGCVLLGTSDFYLCYDHCYCYCYYYYYYYHDDDDDDYTIITPTPTPTPASATTTTGYHSYLCCVKSPGKSGSSTNPRELVRLGECLEPSFGDKRVHHCSSAVAGVQDWTAMAPNRWTGKSKGTVALRRSQDGQRSAFRPAGGIWNMPVKSCEQAQRSTAKNNMFHILRYVRQASVFSSLPVSSERTQFFFRDLPLEGARLFRCKIPGVSRLTLLFPTFPRRHVVSRNRSGKVWQ